MNLTNFDQIHFAEQWHEIGNHRIIDGHKLFFIDTLEGDEVICFLHGFPTSSYDFHRIMNHYPKSYRLVVHDHLGFGYSDKPPNHKYSLFDQADRALALWTSLGISNVHLVAHDYGTSVATEIIARHNNNELPVNLKSISLCNGSILIHLAKLRLIQRLLRNQHIGPLVSKLSSGFYFNFQMRKLWYDKSKFNADEMNQSWRMINYNEGRKVMSKISYYLAERKIYLDYWMKALTQCKLPCQILWAQNDPVAVTRIAEELHQSISHSVYDRLNHCGHYPMLECSERWYNAHLTFLRNLDD